MSAASSGADPHWQNVVALLHFDGTNGSPNFVDETGRLWTRNGSPTITTGTSVYGQSGSFTGGQYITTAASTDFAFGSADLTIEGWVRITNTLSGRYFFGLPGATPNIWIFRNTNGSMTFHFAGVTITMPGVAANTWNHVALSRKSGLAYAYLNGVGATPEPLPPSTNFGESARTVTLGHAAGLVGGLQWLEGQLDEWRITKGVGRYDTPTISVPAQPYPNG